MSVKLVITMMKEDIHRDISEEQDNDMQRPNSAFTQTGPIGCDTCAKELN